MDCCPWNTCDGRGWEPSNPSRVAGSPSRCNNIKVWLLLPCNKTEDFFSASVHGLVPQSLKTSISTPPKPTLQKLTLRFVNEMPDSDAFFELIKVIIKHLHFCSTFPFNIWISLYFSRTLLQLQISASLLHPTKPK